MSDLALLPQVVAVARQAGARLLEDYSTEARPADRADMYAVGTRLEAASLDILLAGLTPLVPDAGWADDEATDLPGAWWVADGIEGGVNHVHGLPEWAVDITLVRDNAPVLTVVHQPVGDLTWTAVRGGGAHLNGRPLRVSAKTALDASIVAGSQAGPDTVANKRFVDSLAVLMGRGLLVRNTIPTTFPLLLLASGQLEAFFQYQPDLPGVSAGSLLAAEAGALVTDLRGAPWRPGAQDVLIAAPGVHAALLELLS